MSNFTVTELSAPLSDWTGSQIIIRSEDCPGGVAAIIGGAEHYANRLAAAEEMYEALKALHSTALKFGGIHTSEYLRGYRHKSWEEMMDALTIALTALAKADGRQP